MRSLAAAGSRSAQRIRLITTSCFSRRSSSLRPRMHRIIRSLMRMRSIAVLMEMTPSIDKNDFSGDEVTADQKGDCVCNVLWVAVTLQGYRVSETLEVTFVLARRRQNQSGCDQIGSAS